MVCGLAVVTLVNWKAHHEPRMSNPFESAGKQNASCPFQSFDGSQDTVDLLERRTLYKSADRILTAVDLNKYSPDDASVDIGLIDPDGIFHYFNVTDGTIDKTIEIAESGNYRLAVKNNSSKTVKISGFVKY